LLDFQRAKVGRVQSADFFVPQKGLPNALKDMNQDILAVLEFWEREKGISGCPACGDSRGPAFSRQAGCGPARELRVDIDQKTGDIRAFARLIVSEKVISKHDQISLFDARRIKADAQRERNWKSKSPLWVLGGLQPNTPNKP
jgi:hypothetical protein